MLPQTTIQTAFYTLCVIALAYILTGTYAPTEAFVWTATAMGATKL